MCSPANRRVFLWEKEGPLHKDELLCLTEESGGNCFLCLANQVDPGGHPPWACPLALVLRLAASGGVSFPPHLPEAGVEAISEDDSHSGRVSSHVSSYTSTLRGFCPVLVLAHQIRQLLSYAWDINLSLRGQGAVTSRKCVFACCFLWWPAGHLGHSPQRVASIARPQTQPPSLTSSAVCKPNSFRACRLDLCPDLTALWAGRGHGAQSMGPAAPTAHQANRVWAGQCSVNAHCEKLSV